MDAVSLCRFLVVAVTCYMNAHHCLYKNIIISKVIGIHVHISCSTVELYFSEGGGVLLMSKGNKTYVYNGDVVCMIQDD